MKAIILISEASLPLAKTLQRELPDTLIYTKNECEGCISITSCHRFIEEHFNDSTASSLSVPWESVYAALQDA